MFGNLLREQEDDRLDRTMGLIAQIADASSKTSFFVAFIQDLYPDETMDKIMETSTDIVMSLVKNGIKPKGLDAKMVLVLKEYIKRKGGYPNVIVQETSD